MFANLNDRIDMYGVQKFVQILFAQTICTDRLSVYTPPYTIQYFEQTVFVNKRTRF